MVDACGASRSGWIALRLAGSRQFITKLGQQLKPAPEPALVPWQQRVPVALAIGVIAAFFAYHQLVGRHWLASDFEYDLRAARRLLAGLNPYTDPSAHPGLPYPFDARFPYPLFGAMLAVPFTIFSSYVAGALFVGSLSAIMAFAVTRRGWWHLCIFASPCYFVTASVANWSPLLVAAAFLPVLYPLAITKPTLAMPLLATKPNPLGYALCIPMFVLSLIVMRTWPGAWLHSLSQQPGGKYVAPVLIFPVVLVLFSGIWWRDRSARLLGLFACVPQHPFFYDQLLLWLIPKTLRQSLALSAVGWAAYLLWFPSDSTGKPLLAYTLHGPSLFWTAPAFYLPAFALVLWQQFTARRATRSQTTMAAAQPVLVAVGE